MVEVEYPVIIYWYQGDSDTSLEITVRNATESYTVSGYELVADLFGGSTKSGEDFRLPIPLAIYNNLSYDEWVFVYEHSLNLLAFSVETVKYSWYQSGPFRAIVQIVGIVLTVWAIVTGNLTLAQIVTRIIIAVAVSYVIQQIAVAIGGELGMLFAFVAAVVVSYYAPGMNTEATWMTWLKSASAGLNSMNQVIQHEAATIMAKGEAYMNEMKAKMEDLEKKMVE